MHYRKISAIVRVVAGANLESRSGRNDGNNIADVQILPAEVMIATAVSFHLETVKLTLLTR